MIDTNSITAVAQNVADVKATIAPYWPMICVVALWLRAEIHKLTGWAFDFAEYCLQHGGLLKFALKLLWNPTPKDSK